MDTGRFRLFLMEGPQQPIEIESGSGCTANHAAEALARMPCLITVAGSQADVAVDDQHAQGSSLPAQRGAGLASGALPYAKPACCLARRVDQARPPWIAMVAYDGAILLGCEFERRPWCDRRFRVPATGW
jgi:hypothetical protein